MRVYILLFNAGTENEGIHTIAQGDRNCVLMFESMEDAERYALMLEAQDFPNPSVESIDQEEVEEFCRDAGYEWELVLDGMLAVPPENNLEKPDWDPLNKPNTTETDSDLSSDEVELMRKRLEGLL